MENFKKVLAIRTLTQFAFALAEDGLGAKREYAERPSAYVQTVVAASAILKEWVDYAIEDRLDK